MRNYEPIRIRSRMRFQSTVASNPMFMPIRSTCVECGSGILEYTPKDSDRKVRCRCHACVAAHFTNKETNSR